MNVSIKPPVKCPWCGYKLVVFNRGDDWNYRRVCNHCHKYDKPLPYDEREALYLKSKGITR